MPELLQVDAAGVRAASLAEIREDLNERQREAFGSDLALSPQVPQSQWSGIAASALSEILEAVVRIAVYGSSVDDARWTWLDQLGSLLGIERITATRSRVTATLTGVGGTGVPAGSRARTPDGDVFESVEAVSLTADGVRVEFRALETGPVIAPAGQLNRIVTVIAGWETVTNAEDAVPGRDRQGDADYRAAMLARTARGSVGTVSSLESALAEARAGRTRVVENNADATATVQGWPVGAHSVLVVAEGGLDADIRRAIENHRGMGVGTMTAIVGAPPNTGALNGIANRRFDQRPPLTWAGVQLTAAFGPNMNASVEDLARQLNGLLGAAATEAVILPLDGRLVAVFRWSPTADPVFGGGDSETALGLAPAVATGSPGPFVRSRFRDLDVSLDVARQPGFPADGLDRIRTAIGGVVDGYGVGEQLWAPDIQRVAEGVPGTRVTNLTVQYDSAAVSGLEVPLDVVWRLPATNLTISVT